MKKAIALAGLLVALLAGTAVAETCYTDCWTDSGGRVHCKTRCGGSYDYDF